MQARAEAANAKALALALLAADYAGKISAARQQFGGDELAAHLSALMAEQRAAERALSTRLAGEAKTRRSDIAKAYSARRKDDRVKAGFRPAAAEVTDAPEKEKPRRPAAAAAGGAREDESNVGEIRTQIPLPDPALD